MSDPSPIPPIIPDSPVPDDEPAVLKPYITPAQYAAARDSLPPWLKPWIPVAVVLLPLLLAGAWFGGKSNTPVIDPVHVENLAKNTEALNELVKANKDLKSAIVEPIPPPKKLGDGPVPAPIPAPVTPAPVPVTPVSSSHCTISPTQPQSGMLVVVMCDVANPLYDFDGVFAVGQAIQSGSTLTAAIPKSLTAKTYTVKCIYQISGVITIERVVINAAGDLPPPPPPNIAQLIADLAARVATLESEVKPVPVVPVPTPSQVMAHITFVGAETTPVSSATAKDAGLSTALKSASIAIHNLKAGDPNIVSKGLQAAVDKAGGLPCWIGQDGLGNVIAQGGMQSAAAVLQSVTPFMKK